MNKIKTKQSLWDNSYHVVSCHFAGALTKLQLWEHARLLHNQLLTDLNNSPFISPAYRSEYIFPVETYGTYAFIMVNPLNSFIIQDAVLANNSLELLVMCLQIRPKLIEMFYKLPNVSEFVVDVLTGSPSIEVFLLRPVLRYFYWIYITVSIHAFLFHNE